MITDKQGNNIYRLSSDDCLEIMRICSERLGLVSVDEYSKIMSIPKRTIYAKMTEGKIKYFEISDHKFPIINE